MLWKTLSTWTVLDDHLQVLPAVAQRCVVSLATSSRDPQQCRVLSILHQILVSGSPGTFSQTISFLGVYNDIDPEATIQADTSPEHPSLSLSAHVEL
jgi:hypothetical protein